MSETLLNIVWNALGRALGIGLDRDICCVVTSDCHLGGVDGYLPTAAVALQDQGLRLPNSEGSFLKLV